MKFWKKQCEVKLCVKICALFRGKLAETQKCNIMIPDCKVLGASNLNQLREPCVSS